MKQMGFDMDFADPVTKEVVPWAKFSPDLIADINAAQWVFADTETTGLNFASKEKTFTGRDYRRGVDGSLRLRIVTMLYPSKLHVMSNPYHVVSFDMDQHTPDEQKVIANAALHSIFVAHNAGFDLFWLRHYGNREIMPSLVLDTMLIARVLRPDIPIVLSKMCTDENLDEPVRQAAEMVFLGGRSGFSLADIILALFNTVVSKEKQGPKNWAEPYLDQKSYDYATDDTIWMYKMLMTLLNVKPGEDWVARYEALRQKIVPLQVIEPQVLDVVVMREHGMPWLVDKAESYINSKIEEVHKLVDELVVMEPSLEKHRHVIASLDQGINAELKQLIGEAFSRRGLELEITEKTGSFKIGEKDLRRAKAQINEEASTLFKVWTNINRAKKAASMAREVSGFATRSGDGRLHPNTGHGPITGRLSSSEPNCFPGHVELLTVNGWQRFSDWYDNPVGVAQVSKDGTLSIADKPTAVKAHYEGELVHLLHDEWRFDLPSTPQHRHMWESAHDELLVEVLAEDMVPGLASCHVPRQLSSSFEVDDGRDWASLWEFWLNNVNSIEFLPALTEVSKKGLYELVRQLRVVDLPKMGWLAANSMQMYLLLAGIETRIVEDGDAYRVEDLWVVPSHEFELERSFVSEPVYCAQVPEGRLVVRVDGITLVTGNCQQFPRDQGFRNCVTAREGYSILASDYSALDMRVGAALAIRAQQQIMDAYMEIRPVAADAHNVICKVIEGHWTVEHTQKMRDNAQQAVDTHMKHRDDDNIDRKTYWDKYRRLNRNLLLAKFAHAYARVRRNADAAGTPEWGALRNAFSIDGMDIHTWTALSMRGEDPIAMFKGLSDEDVAVKLKACKKELGDARQTGKVGNLSLLYAMKTKGLMDAAAKNYNIHWTFEEADKVRVDWLNAYVEIDLWHLWTELNPVDNVFIPDADKGGKYTKKDIYASITLADRMIYAFSLNAALSYEDQSTGADILGFVMKTFRTEHPDIYECIINQVHDEIVFEVPDDQVDEMEERIGRVMKECSEFYLMEYGVKGECSPAVGKVWLKD